jgi:predicted anti-sigma-YlaC factor YlaD
MTTPTSHPHDEFTCKEFVALVTQYLEKTLTPLQQATFEAHLTDCEGCATYLEQMRQTVQILGRLDESSVPAEGKDRLLQAFRKWKYE